MSLDINQFAQSLKTAIVEGLAGARSATAPKNYVQAPEAYDGSRAGYETFRRNLELYVQAIPKDRDRILAALGFSGLAGLLLIPVGVVVVLQLLRRAGG